MLLRDPGCPAAPSHPAWDEWIEIRLNSLQHSKGQRSHPAWDEWIEISTHRTSIRGIKKSHPAWDEWIEIKKPRLSKTSLGGLIPLGMSGGARI